MSRNWQGGWHCPPPAHHVDANGVLHATGGEKTDFWQTTHYGFQRDDDHALFQPATGGFSATLTFGGDYTALYDQAGMLLRVCARNWIKFGIEHTDGALHLSVVAARDGLSDWSAQTIPFSDSVTVRATRLNDAMLLQWQPDGCGDWCMVRLAPAPQGGPLLVGPYLCSPERAGFAAHFHRFDLTDAQVDALH
ncbi:DUF1349 domain-containing protein [Yoonia sp. 208BN28-4]|uniref:DUF1349 domain-containing protein n=1 Tax=Yoonia sp. 208BN28-4 TaxID=3126505 RepID=UPI0030B49FBB